MGLKKIVPILLLLMLLATPAFAAIPTLTINTPANNAKYSNTFANVETIIVNFNYVDNNTTTGQEQDFNVWIKRDNTILYTIADSNAYDVNLSKSPTATVNCNIINPAGASGTCNVAWKMPVNTELPDGNYCIDMNFREFKELGGTVPTLYEKSAARTVCFQVYTGFAQANASRGLLLLIGVIAAAAILIGGVVSITVLNTDPMKTISAMIVGGIGTAILLMLLGLFAGMI